MTQDELIKKYPDSLSQYDIKKIFENPDLGKLNFTEIVEFYEKIASDLHFLEQSDYVSRLYQDDVTQLNNIKSQFNKNFQGIKNYDPVKNSIQERNQWITQFDRLKNVYAKIIHDFVTKIKLENLLASSNTSESVKKLDSELNNLKKEVGDARKIKSDLEFRLNELNKIKPVAETLAKEVGTKEISLHFDEQSLQHKLKAEGVTSVRWYSFLSKGWAGTRKMYEIIIFATIIIALVLYVLTVLYKLDLFDKFWGYRSVVLFGSLLAIEYTGLYFATQNYSREKDLEYKNKNRSNIANTLLLISAKEDEKIRGEIISEAVKTLFADIADDSNSTKNSAINVSVGDIVAQKNPKD